MSTWPPAHLQGFAESLPFEHLLRGRPGGEAMARWRAEAGTSAGSDGVRVALLLELGTDKAAQSLTLSSWALQTWPHTSWIGVGAGNGAMPSTGIEAPLAIVDVADPKVFADLGVDWVVPAIAGDVLHPSLAWTIARAAAEDARLVTWDWFALETEPDAAVRQRWWERLASEAPSNVLTRPRWHVRAASRDGVAELRVDVRARACALRAREWQGEPGSPHRARFAIERAAKVAHHPEPLGMYPQVDAPEVPIANAGKYWGVDFERCPRGVAWPAQPAASVAIAILYRDRPELTCRAIRSVAAQQLPGRMQLVLVDNDSTDATRAEVAACVATLDPRITVTRLQHAGVFNHSRQVQLAADASGADVLVLLNNDAEVIDPDALDRLSRWACVAGVASVGGQVVDADGTCVGGGFHARAAPGPLFNSPVEEARGAPGARSRESIGNTFACVAFHSRTFAGLGGLDGDWFPAGYNDVDYALRAVAAGLTHVTLAEVSVRHAVGASRARQDEVAQKLLLRQRHPWVAVHAVAQFERTSVELPPVAVPGGAT